MNKNNSKVAKRNTVWGWAIRSEIKGTVVSEILYVWKHGSKSNCNIVSESKANA
jgi:hypothetical protein